MPLGRTAADHASTPAAGHVPYRLPTAVQPLALWQHRVLRVLGGADACVEQPEAERCGAASALYSHRGLNDLLVRGEQMPGLRGR